LWWRKAFYNWSGWVLVHSARVWLTVIEGAFFLAMREIDGKEGGLKGGERKNGRLACLRVKIQNEKCNMCWARSRCDGVKDVWKDSSVKRGVHKSGGCSWFDEFKSLEV
jgi:hypothetical protein